jgi:hypothetical protein
LPLGGLPVTARLKSLGGGRRVKKLKRRKGGSFRTFLVLGLHNKHVVDA